MVYTLKKEWPLSTPRNRLIFSFIDEIRNLVYEEEILSKSVEADLITEQPSVGTYT